MLHLIVTLLYCTYLFLWKSATKATWMYTLHMQQSTNKGMGSKETVHTHVIRSYQKYKIMTPDTQDTLSQINKLIFIKYQTKKRSIVQFTVHDNHNIGSIYGYCELERRHWFMSWTFCSYTKKFLFKATLSSWRKQTTVCYNWSTNKSLLQLYMPGHRSLFRLNIRRGSLPTDQDPGWWGRRLLPPLTQGHGTRETGHIACSMHA